MKSIRRGAAALLLAGVAVVPAGHALAAACPADGTALAIGTVAEVAAGQARAFTVTLRADEGVIVDLVGVAPADNGGGQDGEDGARAARSLRVCDGKGAVIAPRAGDVFEKGGSFSRTDEGERLRFVPRAAGRYVIAIDAGTAPRELLVRRRSGGAAQAPIVSADLDAPQKGIASATSPMVFSFAGVAGQWVDLKVTSDKDTVLRLAGPARDGSYSVVAENDDSDGLNPRIRRRLATTGTYYLQVDSLSDEPGEFDLALDRIAPPPPPAPPASLRPGLPVSARLADGDDVKLFALPVVAGHSYRLELTAPYDGVVAVGVANPLEPEDGGIAPDAGFAEIRAKDEGVTGTETLTFVARSGGQVLVRVKSFGIGDSDGGFTLKATDTGQ